MYNFDKCNVLLDIITDISVLRMTASVLQSHLLSSKICLYLYCTYTISKPFRINTILNIFERSLCIYLIKNTQSEILQFLFKSKLIYFSDQSWIFSIIIICKKHLWLLSMFSFDHRNSFTIYSDRKQLFLIVIIFDYLLYFWSNKCSFGEQWLLVKCQKHTFDQYLI